MASDPSVYHPELDISKEYKDLFTQLKPLLKDPSAASLIEGLLEWNCMLQTSMSLAKADVQTLWNRSTPYYGYGSKQDVMYLKHVDKTAAKIKNLKDELQELSHTEEQSVVKFPSLRLPPPSRTGFEYLHLTSRETPEAKALDYDIKVFPLHPKCANQITTEQTNMFNLNEHDSDILQTILTKRNTNNAGNGTWAVMSVQTDAKSLKIILGEVPASDTVSENKPISTPKDAATACDGKPETISATTQTAPTAFKQPRKPRLNLPFLPQPPKFDPDTYYSSCLSSPSTTVHTPLFSPVGASGPQFSPQTPFSSYPTPTRASASADKTDPDADDNLLAKEKTIPPNPCPTNQGTIKSIDATSALSDVSSSEFVIVSKPESATEISTDSTTFTNKNPKPKNSARRKKKKQTLLNAQAGSPSQTRELTLQPNQGLSTIISLLQSATGVPELNLVPQESVQRGLLQNSNGTMTLQRNGFENPVHREKS